MGIILIHKDARAVSLRHLLCGFVFNLSGSRLFPSSTSIYNTIHTTILAGIQFENERKTS